VKNETEKGQREERVMSSIDAEEQAGRLESQLRVLVLAPGFVDPREFMFEKSMTVKEAAGEAAKAFGYRANTPGFQTTTTPPEELPEDKTLVAAGVRDGETLELIDTGGGV
jgi:hypothetical protein